MSITVKTSSNIDIQALNEDIKQFPQVHPITDDMTITHSGVSRLVMLDRYAFKDTTKTTLKIGDFVILTVKSDPKFPARGTGFITEIDWHKQEAKIEVNEEYQSILDGIEAKSGIITRNLDAIDKPLE